MFTGTATPNLGLPQWSPTDHPDFLTDINQAFKDIDKNAGDVGEEIKDVPKQISDLQALTQSLNEDSQQMVGEIAAINVALGNLRGETDKIEPIETQVQGLQVIAKRQSDAIHELQQLTTADLSNGKRYTIHANEGGGYDGYVIIIRHGQILEFQLTFDAEVSISAGFKNFEFEQSDWDEITHDYALGNYNIIVDIQNHEIFTRGIREAVSFVAWNGNTMSPKIVLIPETQMSFAGKVLYPKGLIVLKGANA